MRTAFGRRAFSAASALLIGAALVAGCAKSTTSVLPVTPSTSGASERVSNPMDFRTALSRGVIKPACSAKPGLARCFAYVRPAINGPTSGPVGYGPPDLQSAYNLTPLAATNGTGRVIAVVDAYDDPSAESDLAVYRATYGLPPCTTANSCFHKVNQNGAQGSYPAPAPVAPGQNASWATEISLDLDMVAANCPRCSILLVEANSSAPGDLASSVDTAAAYPGVVAISNSYGIDESAMVSFGHHGVSSVVYAYGASYDHPGIFITAASGDLSHGTAPLFPAVLATVASTGGTTLQRAGNARGWSETAWSGAESSCSAIEYQPSWQSADANVTSVCGLRAVADLSYESDDTTVYGVAVYDTYDQGFSTPWIGAGGTSVAAPAIAAIYGGLGTNFTTAYPFYAAPGTLYDVTSGSNGQCGTLLCNATTGWDGPTGLGTPNGVSRRRRRRPRRRRRRSASARPRDRARTARLSRRSASAA
jgi:hypothetical protein